MNVQQKELRPLLVSYVDYHEDVYESSSPFNYWLRSAADKFTDVIELEKLEEGNESSIDNLLNLITKAKINGELFLNKHPLTKNHWWDALYDTHKVENKNSTLAFSALFRSEWSVDERLSAFERLIIPELNELGSDRHNLYSSWSQREFHKISTLLLELFYPESYVSFEYDITEKFFKKYLNYSIPYPGTCDIVEQYSKLLDGYEAVRNELSKIYPEANMHDVHGIVFNFGSLIRKGVNKNEVEHSRWQKDPQIDNPYSTEAEGHYICLSPDADIDTFRNKLQLVEDSGQKIVIIVDGNNRSIPTEVIKSEANGEFGHVVVINRRRETLEEELRDISCKASVHSRKHIDGTLSIPDWLSGSHYFRHIQPPENHDCPSLPVIALEKYFPQHVKHNKSQQLYYFAKKSERGENIHNKKQFIYGLSDLISRRILRSKINYDAIVPVPSHDGGVSYPLDVSTTVIGETTPLRRHHILKRSQTTGQQKAQNTRIERYKNVADSLGVDVDLNGDQIILIDDICTSGATLNYAAKALYNAGAEDVTGIVYGTTAKRGNTMSIEGPGATIEDLRLAFGGGAE